MLDEHRAQMLLEVTVEQVLTEFLSANHAEISRLTLGVGRGRLADGLAYLPGKCEDRVWRLRI